MPEVKRNQGEDTVKNYGKRRVVIDEEAPVHNGGR